MCRNVILYSRKPVFGICLGHQGLAAAFAGKASIIVGDHGSVSILLPTFFA